jgi:hypothetical protein
VRLRGSRADARWSSEVASRVDFRLTSTAPNGRNQARPRATRFAHLGRPVAKWVVILSMSQSWRPGSGAYPPDFPVYHWWRFGPVELRRYQMALPPGRDRLALPHL